MNRQAGKTPHVTPRDPAPGNSVRSTIEVPSDLVVALLGSADENLRVLEQALTADLHVRGNTVTVTGAPADVALADRVLSELIALVAAGHALTPDSVRRSVGMMTDSGVASPAEVLSLDILSRRGKTIRPKTLNQKRYVDAIDHHTIVFGIGPAGTGKTYLAVAKAVQALQAKMVSRIILTRPAVEAGERLGFLPGTLSEKIDPYLRPLYDALYEMLGFERVAKLMERSVIEIAPLAFMRGRTLDEAAGMARRMRAICDRIAAFPAPVIAALNGHALGGGAGAGAVVTQGPGRGLDDLGVHGEAEVVVRAEVDDAAGDAVALDVHARGDAGEHLRLVHRHRPGALLRPAREALGRDDC